MVKGESATANHLSCHKFTTKQWCTAGSAPGGRCTLHDGLGSRRRLGLNGTNTTQQGCYPAHNDAMTSFVATVSIDVPPHGQLCANMTVLPEAQLSPRTDFDFILYYNLGLLLRYDTIRDAILTCARKPT